MVRKRLTLVVALAMTLGWTLAVAGGAATALAGVSDAAHACQGSGYTTLTREDGSHFRNPGECTSYAARGGDITGTGPACATTANSGCIVFDSVVLSNIAGPPDYSVVSSRTYTISGTWIFSPTCQILTCDWSSISITGNGTYSAFDGTAVVESGTWTASYASPAPFSYTDGSFDNTSCAAAAIRMVTAQLTFSASSANPWLEVRTDSTATGPSKDLVAGFFGTGAMTGGWYHTGNLGGVSLTC